MPIMTEQHNRKSDVNSEFNHARTSDPILLDLLSSVKMINSKQDDLAANVSEVRKSNEAIRDRLTRVEGNQVEMTKQITATKDYVENHAKEEERLLEGQGSKINNIESDLETVKRGFPKNEDGDRDPRSHADDHEIEKEKKKDVASLIKDIRKATIIALLAAIGSGALYLLATGTKVEISRAVQETKTQTKTQVGNFDVTRTVEETKVKEK